MRCPGLVWMASQLRLGLASHGSARVELTLSAIDAGTCMMSSRLRLTDAEDKREESKQPTTSANVSTTRAEQPASALRRPSQASPSVLLSRSKASDQEPPPRAVPYRSISVACTIHCHCADVSATRKLYLCCPFSITRPIACQIELA